jgi:hypothetical protein
VRLHRFHPKPRRWRALAKCFRIFFSTQSRTYEKHRLEWPCAKYCTQLRRIGLIAWINLGLDRIFADDTRDGRSDTATSPDPTGL